MIYKNVNINCISYEVPPVKVTSDEIEEQLAPLYKRLKLPFGRLQLMSGIKERYFWQKGFRPSEGAAAAAETALQKSGLDKNSIGCLIMCSVCRDFLEPATATVVHNYLGLNKNTIVFDISNACLGILTGIINAANMIELGQIESALLVAGENSRPLVESTIKLLLNDHSLTRKTIKPYFASLTIGSGAVAVVMSSKSTGLPGHSLFAASSMAVTEYNDLCRGNSDKGIGDGYDIMMMTDSENLMHYGVQTAAENWEKFKKLTGWSNSTPDCFCTHQVGSAHKKLLFNSLGLDLNKDFAILENYGNSGSVSCPMTAACAEESGVLKKGCKLAMLGIGSGINCTILGVEW
jgi:3-oxoacyl-[acyl-carrier-protein] synthase-3